MRTRVLLTLVLFAATLVGGRNLLTVNVSLDSGDVADVSCASDLIVSTIVSPNHRIDVCISNTATPTPVPTATNTATPPPSSTPTATATPTDTPTATATPISSPTPSPAPGPIVLPVSTRLNNGFTDVETHQIVRTSSEVCIFAPVLFYNTINAFCSPGLTANFSITATLNAGATVTTLDAAFDGSATIHVLALLTNGVLRDYPFNTTSHTFGAPAQLATNGATSSGYYNGNAGVSAMYDSSGVLHVIYQTSSGQLTHLPGNERVDTTGGAKHPVLAIAPDDSLTVAWLDASALRIKARTKAGGAWGGVQTISTVKAFDGIDQGPSMVIASDGTRTVCYIEGWRDAYPYDYGRLHCATGVGGVWTNAYLNYYTHNPAIAVKGDTLYLIGHGYSAPGIPSQAPCTSIDDLCYTYKVGSTWQPWSMFADANSAAGDSFDGSVSVKWSRIGWNLPGMLEVAFPNWHTSAITSEVWYGFIP